MDETLAAEYREARKQGRGRLVPSRALDDWNRVKRWREWATQHCKQLAALGVELDAEGRVPWVRSDHLGQNPTWHYELPEGGNLFITVAQDDGDYLTQRDMDEQHGGKLREHDSLVAEDGHASEWPNRTVYLPGRRDYRRIVFRPETGTEEIESYEQRGVSRGVRHAAIQNQQHERARSAESAANGGGEVLWNFAIGYELDGDEREVDYFSGVGYDPEGAFEDARHEADSMTINVVHDFKKNLWEEVEKL